MSIEQKVKELIEEKINENGYILDEVLYIKEDGNYFLRIVIDKNAHTVAVDGKQIDLSFKEFELLEYFLNNQGRALTRENILSRVWNYDYYGDARTIDTHVKKLRAKLGDKGKYISTIWAVGYKFEVKE